MGTVRRWSDHAGAGERYRVSGLRLGAGAARGRTRIVGIGL